MAVGDLIQIARDEFAISGKPLEDCGYIIRFENDAISVDLPTHHAKNTFDPLVIRRFLSKFNIEKSDFIQAYNNHFKL